MKSFKQSSQEKLQVKLVSASGDEELQAKLTGKASGFKRN